MRNTILVFTANVDKWGAERSVASMCSGLKSNGYNVLVIIPRNGPIVDILNDNGIEYMVHSFPMAIGTLFDTNISFLRAIARTRYIVPDYIRMQWELFSLKKKLQKRRIVPIAVYSASLTIDFGVRFALLCNIKHIQHIRENLDAFGYKLKYGYKNVIKKISKASCLIICTCNAVKDRYANDFKNNELCVVNNGVKNKQNLPIKEIIGKLNIIQTARLMKDKNILDSIKAVEIVSSTGRTKIHLDIYGLGDQELLLKKYVEDHNLSSYITFKGFCDNIDYSKYNVGLMTSIYEAFSRSVLEYMNNGLVAIASNTGGNIEQIQDGETGLLYSLNHPDTLACAISKLYDDEDLINRLALAGREYFIKHFTQEVYIKKITSLITSKING